MSQPAFSFQAFLDKFPPIELPLTLGEETHLTFSRMNQPLPQLMTRQFIFPHEEGNIDAYTEFVPCFRIAGLQGIIALVYWKAGLMDYQYVLHTYTEKGQWIDSRVIAGTYSDGDVLTQSITTIDEDLVITIVSGQVAGDGKSNPKQHTAYSLEILPDGKIIND